MSNTPVRIEASGEVLDTQAASVLLWEAASAFATGARSLIIDLAKVRFIEPLGIAALATIQRRAPDGARIVLASVPPYLEVVVRKTALNDLFEISDDVAAALERLRPDTDPDPDTNPR